MAATSAKEIVLDALDAIYSRDAARALAHYHDDIDFIGYAPVEFFPRMRVRRGKADVMQTVASVHARYSDMRYEMQFVAADADSVAVVLRVHMQKQANARIVQMQVANFYRVRDGLIVEQRQFFDS